MLSLWLLAKVFASGCTAMTGVGAVSNGVNAFREPTQKNAKQTLTIIIVLLMVFLAGIALLCRAYSIGATDPGAAGYQRGMVFAQKPAKLKAAMADILENAEADLTPLMRNLINTLWASGRPLSSRSKSSTMS
jgi:amino acid transporter